MTKLIKEAWDLEVFKRAYAVSLDIHKASKRYPKNEVFALMARNNTKMNAHWHHLGHLIIDSSSHLTTNH